MESRFLLFCSLLLFGLRSKEPWTLQPVFCSSGRRRRCTPFSSPRSSYNTRARGNLLFFGFGVLESCVVSGGGGDAHGARWINSLLVPRDWPFFRSLRLSSLVLVFFRRTDAAADGDDGRVWMSGVWMHRPRICTRYRCCAKIEHFSTFYVQFFVIEVLKICLLIRTFHKYFFDGILAIIILWVKLFPALILNAIQREWSKNSTNHDTLIWVYLKLKKY